MVKKLQKREVGDDRGVVELKDMPHWYPCRITKNEEEDYFVKFSNLMLPCGIKGKNDSVVSTLPGPVSIQGVSFVSEAMSIGFTEGEII